MKRAFTMIELIFVIVILGILAAIALPRLAATRDDAEVSKAALNLTTLISDLSSYYTSRADFAKNIETMTNVAIEGDNNSNTLFYLSSAGQKCLQLTLFVTPDKPAYLKVAKNESLNRKPICKKVWANKVIDKYLNSSFSYEDSKGRSIDSGKGEIEIKGMSAVF